MGNCGSGLNCTVSGQPVQGDPDVAGIGVLVSFIATAVLTFIAIIVGYLSDSLPDATLSQFDRACIVQLSKIRWRPWSKDGSLFVLLRQSMNAAMVLVGITAPNESDFNPDSDERRRHAREGRCKGLERFVLALSDQQLVTGLAILVAGYYHRCSMSIYHFNIVAALAWFSSTTHLSTLAVLRVYLIDHPRVRDWRVVGMVSVLGLLSAAQVPQNTIQDYSLPLQCAYSLPQPITIQLIAIILFLCVSYANRIGRLYSADPDWSIQDFLVIGIVRFHTRESRWQYVRGAIIASSKRSKVEQGATYRKLRQRRRYFRHALKLSAMRSPMSRLAVYMLFVLEELQCAFLGDLLVLLFGVTFGVFQTFESRISVPEAGVLGGQNTMGFGQLVPLFLMALPILAAGEVYYEQSYKVEVVTSDAKVPWDIPMDQTTFFTHKNSISDILERCYGSRRFQPNMPEVSQLVAPRTSQSNIEMTQLNDLDCTIVHSSTATDREIRQVGRADTESGLRILQRRQTGSIRVAAEDRASTSSEHLPSPSLEGQGLGPLPYSWRTLSVLFLLAATFLVFTAMVSSGIGGDTLSISGTAIIAVGVCFLFVRAVYDALQELRANQVSIFP